MRDLIEKEKAVRASQGGIAGRLLRHAQSLAAALCLCCLAGALTIALGLREAAKTDGTLGGMQVDRPVLIYRDARYVPHIRAAGERDGFFAEGFAEGSDRLFQMDLVRRYIFGRLAEVLAPVYLATDERMRTLDARDIVERQWRALPQRERNDLQAFSDGVNAAIRTQPLPIEFRALFYEPARWTPQDSLAVALAVCASIGESADDVRARDALWRELGPHRFAQVLPLSDRRYDVTIAGIPQARPGSPGIALAWRAGHQTGRMHAGSNAWAAGADRSTDGNALLANDPHLSIGIPDLWYAVEMRTPSFHVAGVTIPGIPGVVLGHNEHLAWGSTNAIATTLSVYRAGRLSRGAWRTEVFHLRFGKDVRVRYYRAAHEFGGEPGVPQTLVRWPPYDRAQNTLTTILALDRAQTIEGALRVISAYGGPPQNFLIADDRGRAAYHLAGAIPADPAWGRYVHPARDLGRRYAPIAFDRLPSIAPSRSALAVSANNKMYDSSYPYRLSAMFAPPYRAYRIAQLLRARSRYDAAYFERMQLDTVSVADASFARHVAAYANAHPGYLPQPILRALTHWSGSFSAQSRGAGVEHALRAAAESISVSPYEAIEAMRSRSPPPQYLAALREASPNPREAWSKAGEVQVLHPFGMIGFPFLNGAPLPGNGDEYTIRVQTQRLSQSFRAVWEPGHWERGGLSLPAGESGEIGSGHYDDLRAAWIRGELAPMPFSDASVTNSARAVLRLLP